jgi:hypothetical protein
MQTALRQQFELKLTGLPFNTDQRQLIDFLLHIKAKSCFIPRDQQYRLRPYAFVNFANADDLQSAATQSQKFKGKVLFWMEPSKKHCRSCGAPDHEFKDCTNRKPVNPYRPLYDRFKPETYRPPRNAAFNKFNGGTPYSNAIKAQDKNEPAKPTIASPNVIEALKLVSERLDVLENKLILIEDEITELKNNAIAQEKTNNDINFRLNRLEYMHYVIHDPEEVNDPNYSFPLHDGDNGMEDLSSTTKPIVPHQSNSDDVTNPDLISNEKEVNAYQPNENIQRINLVESTVNDIKYEMRNLIATIGPIIQAASSSN